MLYFTQNLVNTADTSTDQDVQHTAKRIDELDLMPVEKQMSPPLLLSPMSRVSSIKVVRQKTASKASDVFARSSRRSLSASLQSKKDYL